MKRMLGRSSTAASPKLTFITATSSDMPMADFQWAFRARANATRTRQLETREAQLRHLTRNEAIEISRGSTAASPSAAASAAALESVGLPAWLEASVQPARESWSAGAGRAVRPLAACLVRHGGGVYAVPQHRAEEQAKPISAAHQAGAHSLLEQS
jgi:hypothetical protein